jgi:hypothetical protein
MDRELEQQLIARYMGWKEFNAFCATNPGDGDDCWQYEDMKFDTSWEWLMEVAEKIMDLPKTTEIVDKRTDLINQLITVHQEGIYKAVVEFIRWDTQQVKK